MELNMPSEVQSRDSGESCRYGSQHHIDGIWNCRAGWKSREKRRRKCEGKISENKAWEREPHNLLS